MLKWRPNFVQPHDEACPDLVRLGALLLLLLAILAFPPKVTGSGEGGGNGRTVSPAPNGAEAPGGNGAASPSAPDASLPEALELSLGFVPGAGEAVPPEDWQVQEFVGTARVRVDEVGGTGVVRLESEASSFALHRDVEMDLAEFPYITWTWRVDVLPERGDVRRREADDQAAQLYIVFPRFPTMFRSRILGYVWDGTAPAGSSLVSVKTPLARIVVVESGPAKAGRWIEMTRNILEDYRRLFGDEPPRVGKVSLVINSQHTRSRAVSWFGPIRFAPTPPKNGASLLQATARPLRLIAPFNQ
jgi:hypothetical protein